MTTKHHHDEPARDHKHDDKHVAPTDAPKTPDTSPKDATGPDPLESINEPPGSTVSPGGAFDGSAKKSAVEDPAKPSQTVTAKHDDVSHETSKHHERDHKRHR